MLGESDGSGSGEVLSLHGDWAKIPATVDSGAAESVCPIDFMPFVPVSKPKNGKSYVVANGSRVRDEGGKRLVPSIIKEESCLSIFVA